MFVREVFCMRRYGFKDHSNPWSEFQFIVKTHRNVQELLWTTPHRCRDLRVIQKCSTHVIGQLLCLSSHRTHFWISLNTCKIIIISYFTSYTMYCQIYSHSTYKIALFLNFRVEYLENVWISKIAKTKAL